MGAYKTRNNDPPPLVPPALSIRLLQSFLTAKNSRRQAFKSLSFQTPLQIPNHQSFKKKVFLLQPLFLKKNIFQTNLERVPFTKAMGANYKTIFTYKPPPCASRGSQHPSSVFIPDCEEFQKAGLQKLELPNPSADPKPSELQKESFSSSAPFLKKTKQI